MNFYSRATAKRINRAFPTQKTKLARANRAERPKIKQADLPDPSRPIPPGLAWFVIQSVVSREAKIAAWIEALGGNHCIVPLETRHRQARKPVKGRTRRKTRMEAYQVPALPRYVLAGFASPPNWLQISSHADVTAVLGCKGTPQQVSEYEIRVLASTSATLMPKRDKNLDPGLARILLSGAFQGLQVEVLSVDLDRGKATTRQSWFGGSRLVDMDVDALENV